MLYVRDVRNARQEAGLHACLGFDVTDGLD